MKAPMIIPIQIPMPPQSRDCILVDGHRYCRDEPVSDTELGTEILIVIGAFLYAIACGYQWIEKDRPLLAALGILVPPVLYGLFLVLR